MKKILNILILLNCISFGFAQSTPKKSIEQSPKVSTEIHLKAQINALQTCIDSLSIAHQKGINDLEIRMDSLNMVYRMEIKELHQANKENCSIYYDRLDTEFDRMLVIISLIWAIIGIFVGVIAPFMINKSYERTFTRQIEELRDTMSVRMKNLLLDVSRENKQSERLAVGRMRERYKDIDRQLATLNKETSSLKNIKEQLSEIKSKIETSERNAKQSQMEAMISRLYLEASKEYQNNPQRAIDLYTRIILLNEKELEAYNNRAILYLQREEYERAINDTTTAITIDNTFANAYAVRGLAKNKLQKFENAIDDFSKALQYSKDDKYRNQIYIDRAETYFRLERFDKTIHDYDCANKLFPLDANNLNNRANAYLKLQKFDIALRDACEALKLCEVDKLELKSYIYDTIGSIYFAKEMYHEALENFNEAINLNSQLWECYENRAKIYQILISQTEDPKEKMQLQDRYEADIQCFRNKNIVENEQALE